MKPVTLKFMLTKMRKTNGEPYTRRLVRTVRGQALGNLPSQDGKAPSAEPTKQWSPEQIVGRFRLEGIPIVGKTTLYTFLHKDKESGGDLYRHTRHHQNTATSL